MKLLTVGKDISELIEQIKWSGDTKQVARTIQFTIAKNKKDKDFPTVVIDEGAEIIMQDDSGKDVFGGIIFDIDKSASSKVETYLAYDLMFYINNSDVNKIFEGTPETIVPGICTELGIESGTMAATGVNISSMPCFGKKAYEAIMMAYTAAAKQNGRQDMAKNLTIQDEPVYNEQMEVLEPTTPAHADYFNERYAQLLNNGKANRRDAKIFEDDVNGGKMRLGMENGHLYYEEL